MLCRCRCFRLPLVQVKTRVPSDLKPVHIASSPSNTFMNTLSAQAALTSFGVRGGTCGSRLSAMQTTSIVTRLHGRRSQRIAMARTGACRSIGGVKHLTVNFKRVQHARQSASGGSALCLAVADLRDPAVRRAEPNSSLKPSPNGGPPGPGRRYAVHFRQPGPGVPPLGPA